MAVDNDVNPRDYLGKFWIDSITHDADLLEYVLKLQGANRICMGSILRWVTWSSAPTCSTWDSKKIS